MGSKTAVRRGRVPIRRLVNYKPDYFFLLFFFFNQSSCGRQENSRPVAILSSTTPQPCFRCTFKCDMCRLASRCATVLPFVLTSPRLDLKLGISLPADVPGSVSVVTESFRVVFGLWRSREVGEKEGEGDCRRNRRGLVRVCVSNCPPTPQKSPIGWAGMASLAGWCSNRTNQVSGSHSVPTPTSLRQQ